MTLKNISSTVRRYPVAVALNFLGLVFSYLAFTVIFMQVGYELSFDKCHPTSSRVFRVDKSQDNSLFRNILPRGFADDIINSSSHIEAGCVYNPFFPETYITIKEEGRQPQGYRKDIRFVTDGFPEVFGVNMVEMNAGAFGSLSTAVIPESLAETMFPGESALGKILYTDTPYMFSETDGAVTVVGVYEDFPDNTQLDNAIYASLGHFQEGTYGKVLKEMDSVFQHDVLFYDIIGKGLYSGEERLRKLVSLFSLLAVVLSLVGVWGQVLMDVQYRRKEIAVKRVLGAEIKDIAGEGLRHYLKTVAVCFLIAAPAGWAVTDYYLKQFSHRTGFSVTVFLVTLAIVMSLCAVVVLYHYLKTAGSNLEDSLKND